MCCFSWSSGSAMYSYCIFRASYKVHAHIYKINTCCFSTNAQSFECVSVLLFPVLDESVLYPQSQRMNKGNICGRTVVRVKKWGKKE